MKSILVFRHVPQEGLGTIATALDRAGLTFDYVDLFRSSTEFPGLELARRPGLIVLGGPMNVDETDKYPFLQGEVRQIREAVTLGLPILGICLGAQLLAKALGAEVTANPRKEIGWYSLELTPQAATDPLLSGWGTGATVFQWHGDTFALPPGAVHLARSEACENQAFRYGNAAYALQFHLEMTAEMVDDWLNESGNCQELTALQYIDPQAIRRQTPEQLPIMQALGERVFERFAALCTERAGT